MVFFDKFAWIKALAADARFTEKERLVGIVVCVWFTRADGTGWAVKLDEIADRLGGISHNRLGLALGKLVRHGYLQETGRGNGGRGLKAWRSHNLTKPQPERVGVIEKPEPVAVGVLAETPTSSAQNPNQQRTKPQPAAVNEIPPDQRETPPTGTSSGTTSGTERAAESQQDANLADFSAWETDPQSDSHVEAQTTGLGGWSPFEPQPPSGGAAGREERLGVWPDCEPWPDWFPRPPEPCPDGGDCTGPCRFCAAIRKWNHPDAVAARQKANYKHARDRFNQLRDQARVAGVEWRPVEPPKGAGDFPADRPWFVYGPVREPVST